MKYNKSEIMRNAWNIRRTENIDMSSALKKAWSIAKNKEENEMEKNEIKALIEKYSLVQRGEQIGTYATKGINKAEFMREVGPHKDEIIAYFEAEKKAAEELRATQDKTFESIPGVAELRKARAQMAQWKREFNRMMETGDSKMRPIEAPTAEELAAMESRNPLAMFALEAEYRAHATQNVQLYTIWNTTYDALRNGQDPETVKADHDARMAQYTADHTWN